MKRYSIDERTFEMVCVSDGYYVAYHEIKQLEAENVELKKQIDKMKNCDNCNTKIACFEAHDVDVCDMWIMDEYLS